MQITIVTEGGIAFMPGLSRPISLDTAVLPPETQRSLTELVEQAQFFSLPTQPEPLGKARDVQLHSITVVKPEGGSHTVRRHDPLPPPLAALVNGVRTATREQKARG